MELFEFMTKLVVYDRKILIFGFLLLEFTYWWWMVMQFSYMKLVILLIYYWEYY